MSITTPLAALLVFALGIAPVSAKELAANANTDDAAHFARVSAGLRPPVYFTGEKTWSLEERMKFYKVPAVTFTVVQDGKIAWTRVVGLADREAGISADAGTLFQAGSVSKPVSAFGAMRLVQAGTLELGQPVNERLSSWKIPDNEFTAKAPVTLAQLLSHTGGLTVHGFLGYAPGLPVPSVREVLDGTAPANSKPIRVDVLPGSVHRYSGGGYTIAQLLMTEASKRDFVTLMHDEVLAPIGMAESTYANPLPAPLLAHAAAGVLPNGDAVPGKRHTYPEMAAAGLWTTSPDLARFGIEMQKALRGESKLLSAPIAQSMLVPPLPDDVSYGLGFEVEKRGGSTWFTHGGWDEGFCALLTMNAANGQGVVILINANAPAFMDELQRAVAFEYGWPGYKAWTRVPATAAALASVPGRYEVSKEQFAVVSRDGDRLYLTLGGETARDELVPVGDNQYMQSGREQMRSFGVDPTSGQPSLLIATEEGKAPESHLRLRDDQKHPRELLLAGDPRAFAAYAALRDAKDRGANEDYLNNEGYRLVGLGNVDGGIAMLTLNTRLYPASANTWDSLGEAYLAKGDKVRARESYQKALSIDPAFPSSKAALEKLK
jgi:CubicO group peptidase (beta-lactamase class C family)